MNRFFLAPLIGLFALAGAVAPVTTAQSLRTQHARVLEQLNRFDSTPLAHSVAAGDLLEERTESVWDAENEVWQVTGRSVFENEGSYRVEEVQYQWNGVELVPAMRLEYTGDEMQLVTATFVWDAGSAAFVPDEKTEYDLVTDPSTGETHLQGEVRSYWDGTSFQPFERTSYELSDPFVLSGYVIEEWDGANWVPFERELYVEEESAVSIVSQEHDGVEWFNTERTRFPYSSIAEMYEVSRELATEFNEMDGFLYVIQLLPSVTVDEWSGGEWVPIQRQTKHYDMGTGQLVSVDMEENEDGEYSSTMTPIGLNLSKCRRRREMTNG